MGFYGNITNTSKTQFQFDRTYSNRATMEANILTDGIYAGRYILIEYDTDLNKSLDTFPRVYMQGGVAYTSPDFSYVSRINKKDIGLGDIVFTATDYVVGQPLVPTDCVFWKCTSALDEKSSDPATFIQVVGSESNYVMNFNIDTAKYGESRGYDSTVWQKVYINNIEKYVQIAELNSVVPTFDISADAPTIHPIQPHFDINSTNVYYKLHWQPQWGMRVKEAKGNNKTTSEDNTIYPSDEKVEYTIYEYNPNNGTTTSSQIEYDAAIYYNKAGFDKSVRTRDASSGDNIQVAPTGISGNTYNTHSVTEGFTNNTQKDIQEFQIILPSLGNTVSDIWDIIYGHGQKIEADETVSGEISNATRFRDIEWKDVVTGTENSTIGGMTRDLNTLAGCINKVHDLMGMIITDKTNATLNEEWFIKNYIYKENGSYYRIHRFPVYQVTTIGELNLPLRSNYPSDQEYNTAYRNTIAEKLQDKEYFLVKEYDPVTPNKNYHVEILNEKALSALSSDAAIGYWDNQYDYEFIQIPDMPGKMATMYGLILQMKNLLEVEDSETRDTATVTGAINALNDIIKVFEDLVPGEFLICDANGHVNSANWTTEQPFSYYNHNVLAPQAIQVSKENLDSKTDENRWISLSLDKEKQKIELKHIFNKIEDTATTADKNNILAGDGINHPTSEVIDDTLKLYTPIVDAMGHVVGKNTETVTLPYSYKTFTTTGSSTNATTDLDAVQDTVSADGVTVTPGVAITNSSTTADNTQDTLAFNPHNKWIQVKVTEDNITVAHEVHGIQINALTSDINGNGDTIAFQDLEFDAAGHVTRNQKHTYTLPYGFKTVTPATQSTAVTNPDVNTEKIVANNTQDTLTIASTNKWIRMSADDSNNTLSIGHEVHAFEAGDANTKYGLEADLSIADLDDDNTFEVPVVKFDEAGHITFAETHTVTIPENFDKVAVAVTGKDSVAVNGASAEATIQADTLTDTLTFDVGNRWIQIAGNDGADKITVYHAAPGNQTNTTKVGNETPDYGIAFNIPEVKYDEAGHVSGVTTHTVTFPTPSLNDLSETSASVITGLSMVDGKLSITQTNANVGTRALTDYTIGTNNADIVATDSINSAFGKLQVQMHDEETNRANAITNLNNALTQTINDLDTKLSNNLSNEEQERTKQDSILQSNITSEESERINQDTILQANIEAEELARTNADNTLQDNINTEAQERAKQDGILQANIDTEILNRENAIKALSYTNAAVSGFYVSEVAQTNGKISVVRAELPDYSANWNRIEELEKLTQAQDKTIQDLHLTIEGLISRIEALEAHHQPEEEPEISENPEEPIE